MRRANVRKRDTLKVMRRVTLPEYLKAARKDLGISQREAARRANMPAMTINNLESGVIIRPKDEDALIAIAAAYEVDPEELALVCYGLHYEEDDSASNPALDAVGAAG